MRFLRLSPQAGIDDNYQCRPELGIWVDRDAVEHQPVAARHQGLRGVHRGGGAHRGEDALGPLLEPPSVLDERLTQCRVMRSLQKEHISRQGARPELLRLNADQGAERVDEIVGARSRGVEGRVEVGQFLLVVERSLAFFAQGQFAQA